MFGTLAGAGNTLQPWLGLACLSLWPAWKLMQVRHYKLCLFLPSSGTKTFAVKSLGLPWTNLELQGSDFWPKSSHFAGGTMWRNALPQPSGQTRGTVPFHCAFYGLHRLYKPLLPC